MVNSITDVAGLAVGHRHRIEDGWATGVTVVLAPPGTVGAVDVRGAAPGTRETDLLDPANLVQHVDAVVLSGGSAYGLAAADGVVRWLAERGRGFPVGPQPHQVVPIVPAAVLYDLPMSSWGNVPDAAFGRAACEAANDEAADGEVAQGSVGAGAGATAGRLKGGVGTASIVLDDGHTVGALVAVNPSGDVVDLATGVPFAAGLGLPGEFGLREPSTADIEAAAARLAPVTRAAPFNTTLGVVATDAALTRSQCRRLAMAAHDGLARAIRPAHTMFDGDAVFALATGARPVADGPTAPVVLSALAAAAADTFARAVVHAVLAATPVSPVAGPAAGSVAGRPVSLAVSPPVTQSFGSVPCYRQLWPSALE